MDAPNESRLGVQKIWSNHLVLVKYTRLNFDIFGLVLKGFPGIV